MAVQNNEVDRANYLTKESEIMNLMKTTFGIVASLMIGSCAPAMAAVGSSGFELIKMLPSMSYQSDVEQIKIAQDIAANTTLADGNRNASFELYALQGDPYSQIVELDFEPLVKQVHYTTSPPSLHIQYSNYSNVSFEIGWLNS